MRGDPFDEVVEKLANAKWPVCVTAAAGCGKTEAIVRAVALSEGKQLILTHTNAGVAALRSRLRKNSVRESKYRVDTIASWLFKYAIAYPSMSGLVNPRPMGDGWNQVYPSAAALFDYPFIKDVLQATYTGVFVDEYQDCTLPQHDVILKLCEYLPVRVLGDPLQGIFGFRDNALVRWQMDVLERFSPLPDLVVPYRWKKEGANQKLGDNLIEIREKLLAGEEIVLTDYSQVNWRQWSEHEEQATCEQTASARGSIAGIHQWRKKSYKTARMLGGKYQALEEMDCKSLLERSREIDMLRAESNYKDIASSIKKLILDTCGNPAPFGRSALQSGLAILEQGDLSAIADILGEVLNTPEMQVYRRELLTEMVRTARDFNTGAYESFEDAAYAVRQRTRLHGRRPEKHIVSTTLLLKGLEFDHVIVLNANALKKSENFYVAITRGLKSLTVLSSSPVIQYANSI